MTDPHITVLDPNDIRESSLYNKDLAPVSPERRSWRTYNYAALWISMSVNIPTYMLASGMIAGGMNWKQAPSPFSSATCSCSFPCCLTPMLARVTAFRSRFSPAPLSAFWARMFLRFCARS